MPRGGLSKRKVERRHARNRLLDRHGLRLPAVERRKIVRRIQQEGRLTFVRATSNTRSIHRMVIEGKSVLVVYDKARKEIITVLPEETTQTEKVDSP